MDMKTDYQRLVQQLKTERDELNVRMHLAGAELRDEWAELEKRWDRLQARGKQLKTATGESAEEIGAATRQLGEELKAGYRRIKSRLH